MGCSGYDISQVNVCQGNLQEDSWINSLEVKSVSHKTGEEESARVSKVSNKGTGTNKVFWSGRHSRGRWESIGL